MISDTFGEPYKSLAGVHSSVSAPEPIAIEELTKYYGDVRGVEDLTFAVESGEIFGFLGPNGAGKSTAIRLLLGLLKPTSGTAQVLGHTITERTRSVEGRIGYVPGDATVYENVTGAELLDYFATLSGDERREELLDRFPVPIDRAVKNYSRGNRQKLALVQAFMHDPDLLIMDEPTAGLDPLAQNALYELLLAERDRGVTVLFSTHVLSEVRKVCDRVGIIRDGRLVALENIGELLAKSGKIVRLDLAEDPPPDDLLFDGALSSDLDPDGYYRLVVTENFDGLVDVLDRYSVLDLEVEETSLEDVFMEFYGGT
ncbi:ABC transporter related protein [Haladaptatus paucihalophilus DX253]|uniref:ABC transporter related protein n=1 Tax=Haladaptatus paucihalophilus DX253 TaxID=797209 RepID=E7QYA2_HALPU|nr:ABC transporter ATP-binding protein [Haladaptatus paucihalophilus]EFW90568.1 ABC transporter related protein [Haladaptatus paucihalophilus DX253]SHK29229.1 ABC-2 type transport system ATP-binding protein [Haladaptatus paucihalophilus DX253]